MKNYLLIALAGITFLTACSSDGPVDRFDESGNTKIRTDFYEKDKLDKSVYYADGKETKTVYYEYRGRHLKTVRSISADGVHSSEYEINKAKSIERKIVAIDGRALQIVKYTPGEKLAEIQTLRKSGKVNCHIRNGVSGNPRDDRSAYIRYKYDPATDMLVFENINLADAKAEKPKQHDQMTIGIIPGPIGEYVSRFDKGFPQPIYEGAFKNSLSVKLPKGIFKDGIASIYVYAGSRNDRLWSDGSEQWIQLRLDKAYEGFNWYLID